jgi:NADH-quinone oxidoreductase subunit C
MDGEALIQAVTGLGLGAERRDKSGLPSVRVAAEGLVSLMTRLREEERLAFDLLLDHTAVDWAEQGRFELLYTLFSTVHGHYLMVASAVPRDRPVAPTVSGVWAIAHWQEREVFDLFGVLYEGHPDLRRLFLDDDWPGYPLRKDYQDEHMLRLPK